MYNWGNPLWHVLYMIAFNLPEHFSTTEISLLEMFFKNIPPILPCMKCQAHYNNFIKINPSIFSKKEEVVDWIYKLDMSIKKMLNKEPIDKDIRLESMGKELNLKRVSILLCDIRSYYYMNSIKAHSIYALMIYFTILLPDEYIREELKKVLKTDKFTKEVFEQCIQLFI